MQAKSNPAHGDEPEANATPSERGVTDEQLAAYRAYDDARWVGELAAFGVYNMDPVAGLEMEDPDKLIEFADNLAGYVDVARWNRDGQTGPLSDRGLEVLRTLVAEEVADVEEQRRKTKPGDRVAAEDLASMERRLRIAEDALAKAGSTAADDVEDCRQAAARAVVAGFERGLSMLHPSDNDKRAWYRARIGEAREIADPPPAEAGEA